MLAILFMILSIIIYIISGFVFVSILRRTGMTEEEDERDFKILGVFMIIGLFLGALGLAYTEIFSWKIGIIILIASFIVGAVIRTVMAIKEGSF